MKTIEDYSFNVSVSTQHYRRKEDIEWNKQIYSKSNMNLNIFELLIKEGYNFCQCFNTANKSFSVSEKTESNWASTSFVMLDVDDCDYTMDYTVEKLEYKPTIAYTTYSNGKNDLNRFRLIYNFDEEITDIDLYKNLYDSIKNTLLPIFNNKWKDDCGRSVSQQFSGNGNSNNINLFKSSIIYNVNDFNKKQITSFNSIIKEEKKHYINETGNSNNDYWNLTFTDYLDKYREDYPLFFSTPLHVDDDTPYIILPDNYIEIDRYWIYDKNGNTSPRIIRNGQGRKRNLFINGILRRMMIPDISFDYLLYCLTYELVYFIDNTDKDDYISKKVLYKICANAFKADLNNYNDFYKKDKRTFKINKRFCEKYKVSPKSIIGPSRKDIRNYKIGEFYDLNLTDKQNLKILKDNGINVSFNTLQSFKKDMGIYKYNKKQNTSFNSIIKEEKKHYINETGNSNNEFTYNEFENNTTNNKNDTTMKMIGKYTTEEFINMLNNWYNITDIDELDERWTKCKLYFYNNSNELTFDEHINLNRIIQNTYWNIRPSLMKSA